MGSEVSDAENVKPPKPRRQWVPIVGFFSLTTGVTMGLYCVWSVFSEIIQVAITTRQLVGMLGAGALMAGLAFIIGAACAHATLLPAEEQVYDMGPIELALLYGLIGQQYELRRLEHQPELSKKMQRIESLSSEVFANKE